MTFLTAPARPRQNDDLARHKVVKWKATTKNKINDDFSDGPCPAPATMTISPATKSSNGEEKTYINECCAYRKLILRADAVLRD